MWVVDSELELDLRLLLSAVPYIEVISIVIINEWCHKAKEWKKNFNYTQDCETMFEGM